MNVSGHPLSTSQALKLPIPRLPNNLLHTSNTKFPEMLIPNNWPSTTTSQFPTTPTTLPSTQQVITCREYKVLVLITLKTFLNYMFMFL
jgi:hypothetical protein